MSGGDQRERRRARLLDWLPEVVLTALILGGGLAWVCWRFWPF